MASATVILLARGQLAFGKLGAELVCDRRSQRIQLALLAW